MWRATARLGVAAHSSHIEVRPPPVVAAPSAPGPTQPARVGPRAHGRPEVDYTAGRVPELAGARGERGAGRGRGRGRRLQGTLALLRSPRACAVVLDGCAHDSPPRARGSRWRSQWARCSSISRPYQPRWAQPGRGRVGAQWLGGQTALPCAATPATACQQARARGRAQQEGAGRASAAQGRPGLGRRIAALVAHSG